MLNFDTTIARQSLIFSEITYTVRVLNSIERARRDAPLLEARARITELMRVRTEFEKSLPKPAPEAKVEDPADYPVNVLKAIEEIGHLREKQIIPAYIMAGFVSATYTINGEAVTAANVLNSRTPLLAELYTYCEEASELDGETAKNLQSSTTSAGAADGRITITTAPSASDQSST